MFTELIGRLEKAAGPDRELDWAIAERLGWGRYKEYDTFGLTHWRFYIPGKGQHPLPAYTSSIDAALTLVPSGWTVSVHSDCKGGWYSEIRKCGVGTHVAWPSRDGVRASNGAIALCIAALKARQAAPNANTGT